VRADSNDYTKDPIAYINVDAWGEGGTPIIKPAVQGTNCLLVGIDDVLEVPPSLASIIKDTPSLSYLFTVLPESQLKSLENDAGLTVFLPEDDAWDQLHPVIKMYLESPFATGDLRWIVRMHVADGKLGYSDRFGDVRKSKYNHSMHFHYSNINLCAP
jgi:solute carrier family 25 carnitine/acylcarnitine transporter 20/29